MVKYKTLEERIIDSYLLQSSPKFIENPNSKLSPKDQKILYDFTRKIFLTLREFPELLFKEFHEDDAHPDWFCKSAYNKPRLKIDMRKAIKSINDFMYCIYSIGVNENNKNIPKKYFHPLNAVGIKNDNGILIPDEIQELLKIIIGEEKLPLQNFIKCMYNESYEYLIDIFREFSVDNTAYDHLIQWLKKRNYTYVGFIDKGVKNETCNMGLYRKVADNIDGVPFSIYDHTKIGFFIDFDVLVQEPVIFTLRVQNKRKILEKFDSVDETLKDFINNYHTRCSGCNYCIQRHLKRSKNVKRFTLSVEYKNKKLELCPIDFMSTYNWHSLNDKLVEGIIAYLELMEKEFEIK